MTEGVTAARLGEKDVEGSAYPKDGLLEQRTTQTGKLLEAGERRQPERASPRLPLLTRARTCWEQSGCGEGRVG